MTFTEAAAEVLRIAGKALHYKEITEFAIEKNLLSHVGKSPEVTMGARLAALIKKDDKANPIVRVKPGIFALREWEPGATRSSDNGHDDGDDSSVEVNALEVEAATRVKIDADDEPILAPARNTRRRSTSVDDDAPSALTGEDTLRAEIAASGAALFDDEDDDDQPILAPQGQSSSPSIEPSEGGRRRRRRRRRGRGSNGEFERGSGPRLDVATLAPPSMGGEDGGQDANRDPLAPMPRPMIRDRHQIMAGGAPTGIEIPLGEGDELAGKELSDAMTIVLSAYDRQAGAVPFRTVAEALLRRGRLSGDPAVASVQVAASARADNMRRLANGQRIRFRFGSGNRVALTDWLLNGDLVRAETEALAAVERFRDQSRRLFLRRVQELPGHAFVELALVALERIGVSGLKTVRRPGGGGGEAHFQGLHRAGGEDVRVGIVVRKDGREVGRERVSDLRGALHHYGPAHAGWIVTTGQVLSGAREEAAAPTAPPIALYDGLSFCRLLEEHNIGVVKTLLTIGVPDLELFDSLRGN